MTPRYFTRAEAESLLPVVEPILRDLQRWQAELAALQADLAAERAKAMSNGHAQRDGDDPLTRARKLERHMARAVEELTALGIEIKSLETGLIDFPALRDGRVVLLCWRLGEARIAWWHEIDTGFAGRSPLEDEPPTA
jgi:hypothetical protein